MGPMGSVEYIGVDDGTNVYGAQDNVQLEDIKKEDIETKSEMEEKIGVLEEVVTKPVPPEKLKDLKITLVNENIDNNTEATAMLIVNNGEKVPKVSTLPRIEYEVKFEKTKSYSGSITYVNAILLGWYTAKTGGIKIIDDKGNAVPNVSGYTDKNGNYTRKKGLTLYSQWKGDYVTIPNENCTGIYNTTSWTGSYITSQDANGISEEAFPDLVSGQKFLISRDMSFRRMCKKSVTFKYNANGGTVGSSADNVVLYEIGVVGGNIKIPQFVGHEFQGWYALIPGKAASSTDSFVNRVKLIDIDGKILANVQGYTDSNKNWINSESNIDLIAKWNTCKANTYMPKDSESKTCIPCERGYSSGAGAGECTKQQFTITLNPNGGSGSATTLRVKYGDGVKFTNNFTNENYLIVSWNTKPNGTGIKWSNSRFSFNSIAGEKGITSNNTLTLYAQWKKVTFDFMYTGSFSYQDGNSGWIKINKSSVSVSLMQPNWQVKFLSNGLLTVNAIKDNADVFLVGGGGGAGGCWDTRGGGGGGGGFTTTFKKIKVNEENYPITIGNGGGCGTKGGTSSAFGFSALGGNPGSSFWNGGAGGNGGSGGGGTFGGNGFPYPTGTGGSNGSNGENGRTHLYVGNIDRVSFGGYGCVSNVGCKINGTPCKNTRAFCEPSGELYAGGGAGADHDYCGKGGDGGGGGSGQNNWCVCGCPGKPIPNSGGGGAMGAGSSGIVILRNSR